MPIIAQGGYQTQAGREIFYQPRRIGPGLQHAEGSRLQLVQTADEIKLHIPGAGHAAGHRHLLAVGQGALNNPAGIHLDGGGHIGQQHPAALILPECGHAPRDGFVVRILYFPRHIAPQAFILLSQPSFNRADIPYRHCMDFLICSARSGETRRAAISRPKSTATPAPRAVMTVPSVTTGSVSTCAPSSSCS